jgi:peptide/nickel transport system permease protein
VKPTSTFKQKFLASKLATIGFGWIILWVVVAVAGSLLRPDPTPNANDQHLEYSLLPPGSVVEAEDGTSFTYYLGSDRYGRDFLSRVMAGSAISLSVAGIAVLISLIIGLLLGALAGYKGGRVDAVISWVLQVVWTIPTLLMVLAITLAFGKGFWQVFLAIGLTMWVEVARIVRGQFISIRELEYVQAAKALGLSDMRIMFRHMLPNAIGPIIVVAAANFAAAILIESGLSFLGVGARIPVPSWGNIIKEHYHLLTTDLAWLAIIPGALIASLVLAFTWLGDGLRKAFDVN